MSIAALPQKTKDLLSSTSVLVSPVTLVKELVDNSIDAAADTIEVLISLNTIDKIEVRDNGHGIHSDDYNSLGRPGHTSKLRNYDDLRKLAGTTLGFRGQALTSANTVGRLTITTKTQSDPVAAILQIDPKNGGVLKQQCGSAPTGTTVSVTKLYNEVPVREQHVVKEAKKTLGGIKELLQSYAMAKPTIRLTFKVLCNPTLNWKYSPKRSSGFNEAILQILGKDVASRCMESTASFSGRVEPHQNAEAETDPSATSFVFSASTWKPDADFLRLPRQRYFSVDARPVTSTRGTMQKLMAVYTKYLANVLRTDVRELHGAFIRVNIKCPKGAYDVNIEPSKDEVLFEDEQAIIGYFESLCENLYGPLASRETQAPSVPQVQGSASPTSNRSSSVVDVQLTGETHDKPKPDNKASSESTDGELATAHNVSHSAAKDYREQQSSSSDIQQSRIQSLRSTPSVPTLIRRALINPTVLPPRSVHSDAVIFESNKPIDNQTVYTPEINSDMSVELSERVADPKWRKRPEIPHHPTTIQELNTSSRAPLHSRSTARMNVQTSHVHSCQPETRAFSMTPEPQILRHRGAPPRDLDIPSSMRHPCFQQSTESDMPNFMSSGPYQSPFASPSGESRQQPSVTYHRPAQPLWTPPSTIQKDKELWQNHNGLSQKTRDDGLKQTTISFGRSQHQRRTQRVQKDDDNFLQTRSQTNTENEDPLYNSSNRFPANQNSIASAFSFQQEDVQQVVTPGHNADSQQQIDKDNAATQRFSTKALARSKTMVEKEAIETSIPAGDPRAYLLKRQKSVTIDEIMGRPRRFKRVKSTLLPFENIITDNQTREMVSILHICIHNLPKSLDCYQIYDMYILEGGSEEALDMNLSEARRVEKRLDDLLSGWSEAFGERIAVKSNLSLVLEGAGVSIRT